MNFFSLTMQKLCSPMFPSLQDLLSYQFLIVTTVFLAIPLDHSPLIKKLILGANPVKTQSLTVRYGFFLSGIHDKKLHEGTYGCQWI